MADDTTPKLNDIADTASTDDPNEISFAKGDILEILDKKWWQAQTDWLWGGASSGGGARVAGRRAEGGGRDGWAARGEGTMYIDREYILFATELCACALRRRVDVFAGSARWRCWRR